MGLLINMFLVCRFFRASFRTEWKMPSAKLLFVICVIESTIDLMLSLKISEVILCNPGDVLLFKLFIIHMISSASVGEKKNYIL